MSIIYEERLSDSPYIETVMRGRTVSDGTTIRPAENHWHIIYRRHYDKEHLLIVGPWTSASAVSYTEGAELLWIKLKLGTWMPHLPIRNFLNSETILPGATRHTFWLKGAAWQFPEYHNAEAFIDRLVRDDVLAHDSVVSAVAQDQLPTLSPRTMRHRFLRATGLAQSHIRQVERAQRAAALLEQGATILDVVYQLGYVDQSHLTKSLKRFVGKTPAQRIVSTCTPASLAI